MTSEVERAADRETNAVEMHDSERRAFRRGFVHGCEFLLEYAKQRAWEQSDFGVVLVMSDLRRAFEDRHGSE